MKTERNLSVLALRIHLKTKQCERTAFHQQKRIETKTEQCVRGLRPKVKVAWLNDSLITASSRQLKLANQRAKNYF